MTPSVGGRAVRSGLFALSEEGVSRLAWIIGGLVVARYLPPAELGRFALVMALVSAFEVVTSPGLVDALVQSDVADERTQRTVWTTMLLRGVVLAGSVALAAPLLAAFMGQGDLVPLIRLMGLTLFLRACASLGPVLAERRVEYAWVASTRMGSSLAVAAVSIAFAVVTRRAEGVVAAAVIGTAMTTLATYLVPGFRPGFAFDLARLRRLLQFARWRFASGVAFYVATTADDLALGRWMDNAAVGFYRLAFQVGYLPATSLTAALAKVAFPALSELRREHSHQDMVDGYVRYVRLAIGGAAMLSAGVAVAATPLVEALLGPRWLPAIPPLLILCAAGFLRSIAATGGALFLAVGKPAIDTRMQVVRAGVLLPSLLLIVPFGVAGAAVASLLSIVAVLFVWGAGLRRVGIPLGQVCKEILTRVPAPIAALSVGVMVTSSVQAAAWTVLALTGLAFVSTWMAVVVLADRPLYRELRSTLGRRD